MLTLPKYPALLSGVFVRIVLLLIVFCFSEIGGVFAQMPPVAVNVETVTLLSSNQPRLYNGSVVAKETVNLVPRVSGLLTKVAFQEGTTVKKNDLLFEIEDTDYQIKVRTAKAIIKQIEVEIELAQKTYKRDTELRSTGAITEQELDESTKTVRLLEAKLEEAKANLDQAQNDLSYTKIYSPLTGQIGAKQLSQGSYLTPSSGILATIVQYDPMTIVFPISEKEYIIYFQHAGQKDNSEANIEIILADGKPYKGKCKIDFFDNKIDSHTGTIMIYLLCENPDKQLVSGGWTKVKLSTRYANPKPSISVAALMTDGTHHSVYVLNAENKAEQRRVLIGEQVFDQQIILSGLEAGERVVVGGLNKVKSGNEVKPVVSNNK